MKQIACTNVYAMTSITMKEFSQVQLEMLHEAVLYQIGGFEYLGRHDPYFSGRVTELKALAREIEQRLIDLEAKR
jgi:hypothetical protein